MNRRHALFRLAGIPGALGFNAARAQPTLNESPLPPLTAAESQVTLTPSDALSRLPMAAPIRATVDDLLFKAMSLVGVRYRAGGSTPETGFDCSGYVCYLFREVFSMDLPRTADAIGRRGENIKREALQPGDLVFFNTMHRPFTHVGIYVGEDRFIHSPSTGGQVRTESLNERYWVKRWNGGRRLSVS